MTVETATGARGLGAWRPWGWATGAWHLVPVGRLATVVNEYNGTFQKGTNTKENPMDPTVDGKRRATIMKRVHMARKRGERIQVMFDEKGQPEEKHGDELMSWIETVTSFIVDESFRTTCLKSYGEATRNFRYDLYKTFVEEYLNEESVWTRPQKVIDNYPNIEEDDWMKFVQYRTSSQFQHLSDRGNEIRTNNEYSSRGGRDGYRKLDQEIMEYNTQESQGTFESVGPNDVQYLIQDGGAWQDKL
ncbi:hypothetical protein TIFTF001_049483 [Ficus carica]|uniref:Transposase n=1 Tax=Ficus carica TaxID=3494 RepID=A0AA87Z512_FICCA|nr:hypothetical protein TIFTF001_049483 [Ficus carica]